VLARANRELERKSLRQSPLPPSSAEAQRVQLRRHDVEPHVHSLSAQRGNVTAAAPGSHRGRAVSRDRVRVVKRETRQRLWGVPALAALAELDADESLLAAVVLAVGSQPVGTPPLGVGNPEVFVVDLQTIAADRYTSSPGFSQS
jgi:hypothetical protein